MHLILVQTEILLIFLIKVVFLLQVTMCFKDQKFALYRRSIIVLMCLKLLPLLLYHQQISHLAANVNRDADDHGGNCYACNEGDANWSSNQCAQLPQNLLLPAPRLLPPERTAGWTTEWKHRGRKKQKERYKTEKVGGKSGKMFSCKTHFIRRSNPKCFTEFLKET